MKTILAISVSGLFILALSISAAIFVIMTGNVAHVLEAVNALNIARSQSN